MKKLGALMIQQRVILEPQTKEDILGNILRSFGIRYQYISCYENQYFDIFEIKLDLGTKLSKLDSVMMDVGLALCSKSPPRGYPVLDRGVFRVEVQKHNIPSPALEDFVFPNSDCYSPIALGIDHAGSPIIVDLNSIPNLLVAGATGSGKSMLLHSIILSLLANKNLVYLVDPKMVEFSYYKEYEGVVEIHHDADKTLQLIKDLNLIMEDRFRLLKSMGLRHAKEAPNIKPIVLIIDEWADMISHCKDMEKHISMLAQKGRAAGISIVLATQRPSSKVVSGLIKANFIGRVCMRVSSATDSRIILDQNGGEKIREIGTGLFIDGNSSEPIFFKSPNIQSIPQTIKKLSIENKKRSIWNRIFG